MAATRAEYREARQPRKVRAPKRRWTPCAAGSGGGPTPPRSSAGSWSPARPSTATTSSDASIRPVPMGEPVAAAVARRLDGCGRDELVACAPGGIGTYSRACEKFTIVGTRAGWCSDASCLVRAHSCVFQELGLAGLSRDWQRHDASCPCVRRSTAVKRIRTGGLVGTATVGAWAVAWAQTEPPRQSVVLVVIAAGLVILISLGMVLLLVDRLTKRRYTFMGPGKVVLKPPSEPVSPEPEPLNSRSWIRRNHRPTPSDGSTSLSRHRRITPHPTTLNRSSIRSEGAA
jgi:hypothetical protein